jgi:hypothetical protein
MLPVMWVLFALLCLYTLCYICSVVCYIVCGVVILFSLIVLLCLGMLFICATEKLQ